MNFKFTFTIFSTIYSCNTYGAGSYSTGSCSTDVPAKTPVSDQAAPGTENSAESTNVQTTPTDSNIQDTHTGADTSTNTSTSVSQDAQSQPNVQDASGVNYGIIVPLAVGAVLIISAIWLVVRRIIRRS